MDLGSDHFVTKELEKLRLELAVERRNHYYTRQALDAYVEDEERFKTKIEDLISENEHLRIREASVSRWLENF